jgi:acylphosphatase
MEKTRYGALHLYVSGRVQGVGFRFFTVNRANRYGITGWVKNLYDGRVEIEAEGKVESLKPFLEDIRVGPSYGHVSNVVEQWNEIGFPRYKSFTLS